MARLTKRHLARPSAISAEDRELLLRGHPIIDGTNGVKELDVWTFFSVPLSYQRFPADQRHRHRQVDFKPSHPGQNQPVTANAGDSRQAAKFTHGHDCCLAH